MSHVHGFPPVCGSHPHTLILGSMPGRESIARQRYYAHPRNSFWPILAEVLGIDARDYQGRTDDVMLKGFAIWDVLQACFRRSSLDSDIDDGSIVSNDFKSFYQQYPRIKRVFFNGAKAESMYLKYVLPGLRDLHSGISMQRLPSTSPAHASMTVAEKCHAWKIIAI